MKRTVAILAAILLTFAVQADGCGGLKPKEGKSAPPAVAPPPVKGNGGDPDGQQPAPVQGDPNAKNTQEGDLEIQVGWESERKDQTPACEWSLNSPGVGNPCDGMVARQVNAKSPWLGLWKKKMKAKSGDIVWLSAQANRGGDWVKCSYIWKGKPYDLPDRDDDRQCGGQAKLP